MVNPGILDHPVDVQDFTPLTHEHRQARVLAMFLLIDENVWGISVYTLS